MARHIIVPTVIEAANTGAYAEKSVLPDDLDIELKLSRNEALQPFFLVCQHDTVLIAMSGKGQVHFRQSSVSRFRYGAGDFIYVPAGTPHRIEPAEETIHYRYKLPESRLEAVAWFCDSCGSEIHRDTWELEKEPSSVAFTRACAQFNDDAVRRTCQSCGVNHPTVDVSQMDWQSGVVPT